MAWVFSCQRFSSLVRNEACQFRNQQVGRWLGPDQVSADTQPSAAAESIGGSLEEAHVKVSSLVSDLLGASAGRMLKAVADGETNRETLAALADRGLRATREQLQEALGVCQELNPAYRRLIRMVRAGRGGVH